jgi:hypothetical protein
MRPVMGTIGTSKLTGSHRQMSRQPGKHDGQPDLEPDADADADVPDQLVRDLALAENVIRAGHP